MIPREEVLRTLRQLCEEADAMRAYRRIMTETYRWYEENTGEPLAPADEVWLRGVLSEIGR